MATENNTINTRVTLDASEAQQEIVKLNGIASDGTKDLEERVAAKNKQLELQEKLNKTEIIALEKKIKSLKGVVGSEKELAKAEDKLIKTRVKTLKQETNLIKQSNGLSKALASTKGSVNKLDNATGGLITSFTALAANPIILAITVLVGLFKLLKEAFTSSEEGQDKWNKAMGVASALLGNLLDLVADVAEKLVWMFTEPKQAIRDLGKFIKDMIVTRLNGLLTLLPSLSKAIGLVFAGKFSEAGKVAVDAMGKVVLGVDSVTASIGKAGEALDGFIKEQEREAGIASDIADKRAKANKLDTELILQRANANKERAELLNKAENKEKFNAEQRAEFLRQASKLEEDITNKEIAAGKLRFDAKVLENGLSRSSLEDKQEEARLSADLINLQTAKLTKEKEIITKIIGFNNEARASSEKARAAKQKEDEDALKRRALEIQGYKDEALAREQIEAEAADKKVADEDAERARLADVAQRDREARNEIDALEIERRFANGEDTLQMEMELLIRKRDQELENEKLTALEKEEIQKAYGNAIGSLQMLQVSQAKASDKMMIDSAIGLAGDAFGVAKELAIAKQLIAAPEAIGAVWTQAAKKPTLPQVALHGVVGTAMVVAPIIKGLASIKKEKMKGKAGGKGSGGGGGTISMPSGVTGTSVDDLSANNAANINLESGLNSSASSAAASNVSGSSSGDIVFSESAYSDFQDQVGFVEGATTVD
tara:strand:+ start:4011 stop:6158 length:2148 start_codon:yes stop_codon:yes gene_type:complete